MTEQKRKFAVISNDNYELKERERSYNERDRYERARRMVYQSNPLKVQGQSLKEQFLRFSNDEGGPRFTVEDLLKW